MNFSEEKKRTTTKQMGYVSKFSRGCEFCTMYSICGETL